MTSTATAPGKIILFGEHAVVYGRPAIAAPMSQIRATAVVEPIAAADVLLSAPDMGLEQWLSTAAADDPIATPVRLLQAYAGLLALSGFHLSVTSTIPIASGLGSGAAISVSVLRAVGLHLGLGDQMTNEVVSALAFEAEKLHHGTPSGIDNTVVTYEQPVYFVRGEPTNRIETFRPHDRLHLLVGDTGVRSSTKDVVGDVRRAWSDDRATYERLFDACGAIAEEARAAISTGQLARLGELMDENQMALVEMGVSSAELDRLVAAARAGGALGAKLSGGGRGGNMIALVSPDTREAVGDQLLRAGAVRVLEGRIRAAEPDEGD